MRFHEIFLESPIGDISYHGSDEPRSLKSDNIAIAKSDRAHAKIKRVLVKCPVTINLMFVNHDRTYIGNEPEQFFASKNPKTGWGQNQHDQMEIASGIMTSAQVKTAFGIDVAVPQKAITVIFGHDQGDDRMPFTPWIIAHRMMHVIWGATRGQNPPYRPLLQSLSRLPNELPMGVIDPLTPLDIDTLVHALGTFRSARNERIGDVGEFIGECLAQYLITGHVTFNKISHEIKPVLTMRAKIRYPKLTIPSGYMIQVDDPTVLNDRAEAWRIEAEKTFLKTLYALVGKIVVL